MPRPAIGAGGFATWPPARAPAVAAAASGLDACFAGRATLLAWTGFTVRFEAGEVCADADAAAMGAVDRSIAIWPAADTPTTNEMMLVHATAASRTARVCDLE